MLTEDVLKLVTNPEEKTILEIGAHDDTETLKLARHFKYVFAYYEFCKIPERSGENFEIKKLPFKEVLPIMNKFDVVLMENEFHHFPDVVQMQTYDNLKKEQDLLIVEWNGKGNVNGFYKCFQNCAPLSEIMNEIMQKFLKEKRISIAAKVEGEDEYYVNSQNEMSDVFKFMLPDHWKFGEEEFLKLIKGIKYPIKLWEGYNIFKIKKT